MQTNTFPIPRSRVGLVSVSVPEPQCDTSIIARRDELKRLGGLHLAGLIIDYGIMLDEESDPIEVVLDYEFYGRRKSWKSLENISEL